MFGFMLNLTFTTGYKWYYTLLCGNDAFNWWWGNMIPQYRQDICITILNKLFHYEGYYFFSIRLSANNTFQASRLKLIFFNTSSISCVNLPQRQTVWIHIQATPWWWSCIWAWPGAGPPRCGGTTSPRCSPWWQTSPPLSTSPTSAPPPCAASSLSRSSAPVAGSRPGSWSSDAPEFGLSLRLLPPWWTGGCGCVGDPQGRRFPESRWPSLCHRTETAGAERPGAAGSPLGRGSGRGSNSRGPEENSIIISTDLWMNLYKRCMKKIKTHLLKHERKLHPLFRHALHIQEAVKLEIEFPLAFILSFLTASQSVGKATNLSFTYLNIGFAC